jgi:osmotically-inducible protein OsmY
MAVVPRDFLLTQETPMNTVWLRLLEVQKDPVPFGVKGENTMNNNKDLRRDVQDELDWEPSIDAAEIGVMAHDGVVTLSGAVKTYSEKLAAQHAAERVEGVRAIANELEVRSPGVHERTDLDIAHAAVSALKWKTLVEDGQIKVAVSKGWITLEGMVDWQFQKDTAVDAVRHLIGVKGVTNLIAVKPRVSATEVKSRIDSGLRRSADLEAQNIQVETRNGKVTLRGDVQSWSEREDAERMAWAAPGVVDVENLIAVVP